MRGIFIVIIEEEEEESVYDGDEYVILEWDFEIRAVWVSLVCFRGLECLFVGLEIVEFGFLGLGI